MQKVLIVSGSASHCMEAVNEELKEGYGVREWQWRDTKNEYDRPQLDFVFILEKGPS